MDNILRLAVTFAAGIIGGVAAKKLKFIPAAFMLGSLILTVTLNLSTGYTYFPYLLRVCTQILAGTYLGLSITKERLYSIKTFWLPIVLVMSFFMVFCFAFGFLAHKVCGIDLVTALYCFAPGGVSDIAIIADSVGGDTGMITFMQLTRLITVFMYYPFLFQYFAKKGIIHLHKPEDIESAQEGNNTKKTFRGNLSGNIDFKDKLQGTLIAVSFAAAGGILGYFSGMPAGAMVFSMMFAIIINIICKKTYMPIQMRFLAQIMSGIYLALRITPESIALISRSGLLLGIMILSVMTMPLLFGYIVHKITKLELATAFFCCSPGGMSELTLLAEDMGADFIKVSVTHLTRSIIVISVFPQIINFVAALAG